MEIECTSRNFRRNELAPIGAYLSDEDGLIALLGARATRCSKIAGGRQSEFCLTLSIQDEVAHRRRVKTQPRRVVVQPAQRPVLGFELGPELGPFEVDETPVLFDGLVVWRRDAVSSDVEPTEAARERGRAQRVEAGAGEAISPKVEPAERLQVLRASETFSARITDAAVDEIERDDAVQDGRVAEDVEVQLGLRERKLEQRRHFTNRPGPHDEDASVRLDVLDEAPLHGRCYAKRADAIVEVWAFKALLLSEHDPQLTVIHRPLGGSTAHLETDELATSRIARERARSGEPRLVVGG